MEKNNTQQRELRSQNLLVGAPWATAVLFLQFVANLCLHKLLLSGKMVRCSGKARALSFVGVLLVMSDLANFHEICTTATCSGSLFIILPLNICITIIFITILSSPLTHNLYSELMTLKSHYAYPPTSYLPYHMPVSYYYPSIYHCLVSYHPKILYFIRKCG